MAFVYVGSSPAAQVAVKGSPAFGKAEIPAEQKKGIQVLKRTDAGSLEPVNFVPLDTHIGWICAHPTNGCIYASSRDGNGPVHALRTAPDGSLTPVGAPSNGCGNAPHIDLSPDGGWILMANYGQGTISSLPIQADGSVGPCADSKHHAPCKATAFTELHADLSDRQEGSHPHHIRFSPGGARWALVCDLGADLVWVYGFDHVTGAICGAANSAKHVKFSRGSGPRHLDFHPSGKWVYVLTELSCEVVQCSWDADTGALKICSSVAALPADVQPCRLTHSGAAHILCSPDGKNLYTTMRGNNTVVHFSVDPATGELKRQADYDTTGFCPRNFHLDYDATPPRLRAANQDSQTIAEYAIKEDGSLDAPTVIAIPGVCPTIAAKPYVVPKFL